jgi:hypothetical protein
LDQLQQNGGGAVAPKRRKLSDQAVEFILVSLNNPDLFLSQDLLSPKKQAQFQRMIDSDRYDWAAKKLWKMARRMDPKDPAVPFPVIYAQTPEEIADMVLLGPLYSEDQSPDSTGPAPVDDQNNPDPTPQNSGEHLDPLTIGMNLAAVNEWSTEWVWVDVFKHSRSWTPQLTGRSTPWNTKAVLNLTPEGWPILDPGQAAGTTMCVGTDGHYPGGVYTVEYEGKGKLSVSWDAQVISEQEGRLLVQVTPQKGIYLRIDESDPEDPVRNIHVWMPGFEHAESSFHPLFLERLSHVKAIRFMDWMRTNNSVVTHWSDRTTPQSARQNSEYGVALEYMIELCNTLHASPWFCMPHKADDEYIRQFATLVKDRLDPSLKVHIEYSNEVWNPLFRQYHWTKDQGAAIGFTNPVTRFYTQRAVQIFAIWEDAFGGTDPLVRVLGSQASNPWVSKQALSVDDAYLHADVLAIAPYFGLGNELTDQLFQLGDRATIGDVLDFAEERIEDTTMMVVPAQAQIAKDYGVKLVAYEGGQHILARNEAQRQNAKFVQTLIDANSDPRMYDLYALMFNTWAQAGGDLFMAFNSVAKPNVHGSWGHMVYQDQPTEEAPKYHAVLDAALGQLPFIDVVERKQISAAYD